MQSVVSAGLLAGALAMCGADQLPAAVVAGVIPLSLSLIGSPSERAIDTSSPGCEQPLASSVINMMPGNSTINCRKTCQAIYPSMTFSISLRLAKAWERSRSIKMAPSRSNLPGREGLTIRFD